MIYWDHSYLQLESEAKSGSAPLMYTGPGTIWGKQLERKRPDPSYLEDN